MPRKSSFFGLRLFTALLMLIVFVGCESKVQLPESPVPKKPDSWPEIIEIHSKSGDIYHYDADAFYAGGFQHGWENHLYDFAHPPPADMDMPFACVTHRKLEARADGAQACRKALEELEYRYEREDIVAAVQKFFEEKYRREHPEWSAD